VWRSRQKWRHKFDFTSEVKVAKWLNKIGKAFAKVANVPLLRVWKADSCTIPLRGASADVPLKVKPDITLVDNSSQKETAATWGTIHAFGEVTSQDTFHPEMRRGLYTKTHIMFATQETRRFVPSLAFYGNHKKEMRVRLCMFDREGMIYEDIPLKSASNAILFICIIAGFMCGDPVMLGYDPTVTLKATGEVDTITVEGEKTKTTYVIAERLHVATGLVGRCTRVWRGHDVKDPSKAVIIKDAWPHHHKANTEAIILNRLHGIEGAPAVLQAVTVKAPQYEGSSVYLNSTHTFRLELDTDTVRARKHRRLVMTSVGRKIHHFRKLSELIGAFRDVIESK
jgi:hypothetical protein